MELEVKQEKLSRALGAVSRVAAGARSTLPILANVLIKSEGGKVSLTTTNLDMAVVDYVPVLKSTDGVITVPARLLTEFVSNLPRGEVVNLKVEGIKVKLQAGKYTSTMNGVVADDFPELPGLDDEKAVTYRMGIDEFKLGISEVIMATSNDTTRPVLTGVSFFTDKETLMVGATDGYRIAEKRFIEGVKSEVKAVVPTQALQEVMRSLSDEDEEIEIVFEDGQVRFRFGEIELTSKLIDGSFPNFHELISKTWTTQAIVDQAEMLRAVKMARVFSTATDGSISLEVMDGEVIVSSISSELGENQSEIAAKTEGVGKKSFSARYMMDALGAMEEGKVRIEFDPSTTQMAIRNEKSENYVHIVMTLLK